MAMRLSLAKDRCRDSGEMPTVGARLMMPAALS